MKVRVFIYWLAVVVGILLCFLSAMIGTIGQMRNQPAIFDLAVFMVRAAPLISVVGMVIIYKTRHKGEGQSTLGYWLGIFPLLACGFFWSSAMVLGL